MKLRLIKDKQQETKVEEDVERFVNTNIRRPSTNRPSASKPSSPRRPLGHWEKESIYCPDDEREQENSFMMSRDAWDDSKWKPTYKWVEDYDYSQDDSDMNIISFDYDERKIDWSHLDDEDDYVPTDEDIKENMEGF